MIVWISQGNKALPSGVVLRLQVLPHPGHSQKQTCSLHLHQMQQQQTELEETEFLSAMEAQIALLKLELGGAEDVPASLNLTQWFSEQLPQIRQYFKNKDIHF